MDRRWPYRSLIIHNLSFYLVMTYVVSRQSFVLYLILPEDVKTASKFTAKLTTTSQSPDSESPDRKLSYEGPVISIEDIHDVNSNEASSKYWVVPCEVMRSFFIKRDINSKKTIIKFIIQVEVEKYEAGKKRKRESADLAYDLNN